MGTDPIFLICARRAIAGSALWTFALAAQAGGSAAARLPVSAEVSPSVVVNVGVRLAEVRLSEADIARGYVELRIGSLAQVKSGATLPVALLEFEPSGVFRSLAMGESTFRLGLAEGARPGRYSLPLGLTLNF
jgi:hypothetical protein